MYEKEMTATRRYLHRHPEPSFDEHRTAAYIGAFLDDAGIKWQGIDTSVAATLDTGRPGRHICFRADIDALCLQETNTNDYRSENPGVMHACGHDAHMTILLYTAKRIKEDLDSYCGRFTFIFQHGEEIPPGGAETLIRAGVLDGVEAIYGLHCDPEVPLGQVMTKAGPLMAAADRFKVTVTGSGGHGAMPHLAVDPIVTAAQMITALQTVVSRNTDPLEAALVTIGIIKGGDSFNVIPEEVTFEGTVRTLSESVRQNTELRVRQVLQHTATAYGGSCQIQWQWGYPVLVNHEAHVALVKAAANEVLGDSGFVLRKDARLLGEDFASYLQKVPGAFFFLGTCSGEDTAYPLHNPRFDLDERALGHGVDLFLALAKKDCP